MAQYGRPNSDIRTGIFSPSTGATLYGCIDETSPSDADFISGGGSADYAEVGLSSVTDPSSSTGHIVSYRIARNPTNRAITLVVRLMQGATEIASWTHVNENGITTFNQTLSGAQADAITNYGSLSLRFDVTSSHASGVSFVYWAELEVPDVTDPKNVLPGLGELALAGFAATVAVTNNLLVTPGLGELLLSGFSPIVAVTDHKNIEAGLGELVITGFEPTISIELVGSNVNAEPINGALLLEGFAPIVSVGSNIEVLPSIGELTLTGFEPVIAVGDNKNIQAGLGELTIEGFAPEVQITDNVWVVTELGELVFTGYEPSVQTLSGTSVITETGELIIQGYSPIIELVKKKYYLSYNNINGLNQMIIIRKSADTDLARTLRNNSGGVVDLTSATYNCSIREAPTGDALVSVTPSAILASAGLYKIPIEAGTLTNLHNRNYYLRNVITIGSNDYDDSFYFKIADNSGVVISASHPRAGTTANRPTLTSSDVGFTYYDTTLGKLIVWTGSAWDINIETTNNFLGAFTTAEINEMGEGLTAGDWVFNTDLNSPYWWNGSAFV